MLFVLAFDHRSSFRRSFFGIEGQPTDAQQQRCRDAKLVILDGLLDAVRVGLPVGRAGALVDDEYGAEAALRAKAAGIIVAMPVEQSGRRELEFEHEPFYAAVEPLHPDYVKVLVRYNPEGDAAMNRRQVRRMATVQDWAVSRGVGFMLELLVPPEPQHEASDYDTAVRPRLTIEAVKELLAAGLRPELWKLEGMESREQYAAIALEVLSARPDARCLVLGRGADEEAVARWLSIAAPVRGFDGFAVGRTIWWEPLRSFYKGDLHREDAVKTISGNFLRMAELYVRAANVGKGAGDGA